jgi:hypothetical protein
MFCNHLRKDPRYHDVIWDWRHLIRDCIKGTTIAFLRHICLVDRVKKRNVHQYLLQFKMLYNKIMGAIWTPMMPIVSIWHPFSLLSIY